MVEQDHKPHEATGAQPLPTAQPRHNDFNMSWGWTYAAQGGSGDTTDVFALGADLQNLNPGRQDRGSSRFPEGREEKMWPDVGVDKGDRKSNITEIITFGDS